MPIILQKFWPSTRSSNHYMMMIWQYNALIYMYISNFNIFPSFIFVLLIYYCYKHTKSTYTHTNSSVSYHNTHQIMSLYNTNCCHIPLKCYLYKLGGQHHNTIWCENVFDIILYLLRPTTTTMAFRNFFLK